MSEDLFWFFVRSSYKPDKHVVLVTFTGKIENAFNAPGGNSYEDSGDAWDAAYGFAQTVGEFKAYVVLPGTNQTAYVGRVTDDSPDWVKTQAAIWKNYPY